MRRLLLFLALVGCGPDFEGDYPVPDAGTAPVDLGEAVLKELPPPRLLPDPENMPDCVSACGAELYGSKDCETFQIAEGKVLQNVPQMYPMHDPADAGIWVMDTNQLCDALEDWVFVVLPSINPDVHVPPECKYRASLLSSADWHKNEYAHNIAHIVLGCNMSDDHFRWEYGADQFVLSVQEEVPERPVIRQGEAWVEPGAVGTVPVDDGYEARP